MVIEPKPSELTTAQKERMREIVLDNGNKIHIQIEDPYGHWRLHLDKGILPTKLRGVYTEYRLAEQAALHYAAEKRRTVHTIVK